MKVKNVMKAYKKAIKVIDSCENLNQLEGASNYANNFLQYFSKHTNDYISGNGIYEVDSLVETAYQRLRSQLQQKKGVLS